MFCVDENKSISWCDGPQVVDTFASLADFEGIAKRREWTKQTVTDIWNGFASTAGPFADLKPVKRFRNRPYGLAQIWKAIRRLVPSDAASEPAAPKTTCQECNGSGEEDGDTCGNCNGDGYLTAVADTVEDMPKKKAKRAKKVPEMPASEVDTKPGSNLGTLIKMIGRKSGASIEEIMDKTGWSATHTVRGRISILKSKGVSIESFKHETRGRVYRTA